MSLPLKNIILFLATIGITTVKSQSNKSDTSDLSFQKLSSRQEIRYTAYKRLKQNGKIKSIAKTKKEATNIEFINQADEENLYLELKIVFYQDKEKSIDSYRAKIPLENTIIELNDIHQVNGLTVFLFDVEKHGSWKSDNGNGSSLKRSKMILYIVNNYLYYKQFHEYSESVGVDYRTGSILEKEAKKTVHIENSLIKITDHIEQRLKTYSIENHSLKMVSSEELEEK
ncbi:MAG: hypothetical protein RIM99_07430 [Cyclobacteriaceae bacterium]